MNQKLARLFDTIEVNVYHAAPSIQQPGKLLIFTLASVILIGVSGCNGAPHGMSQATAPTLPGGDGPSLRNVANPNAPFLLKPAEPKLAKRQPLLDVNGVKPCAPGQLTVFESRARVSGIHHTLRLSVSNQGDACRLGGYPAVTLLDEGGRVVGSIVTQRVSADAMTASLIKGSAPAPSVQEANDAETETPTPQVLLAHSGEAAFELGWSTGPTCTPISRIAVGTPGLASATPAPIFINRPLRLCDGTLLVTALSSESAAQ